MHSEAVEEKVTIIISLNGEPFEAIEMPVFKEDNIMTLDMASYKSGHLFNKERTYAPYNYSIRLSRRKTPAEEGKEDADT